MVLKIACTAFLLLVAVRTSVANCIRPDNISDAIILSPPEKEYSPWSRVSLSCSEGFTGSGPEYMYCVDENVWKPTPEEFKCSAGCNAPNVHSDVLHFPSGLDPEGTQTFYDHETTIEYACAKSEGATLVGPSEATCENGEWNPAMPPSCNGCEPPQVSDTSKVDIVPVQDKYSAYSFVTLACSDEVMYTAKGPNVTYCEKNGEWLPDPKEMICRENCLTPILGMGVVSYPYGGTPDDARKVYKHNEVIQNTCLWPETHTLVGPSTYTCVDGIWLPDIAADCIYDN